MDDFDDDNNQQDEDESQAMNPFQRQQAMKAKMNLDEVKQLPCFACKKTVFEKDRMKVDGKVFHKSGCFVCAKCKTNLDLGKFAALKGIYYCVPHYTELLKAAGGKIDKVGSTLPEVSSASAIKSQKEQGATDEAKKFASGSSEAIKLAREANLKAAQDKSKIEKEQEKTQSLYDQKKAASSVRVASAKELAQQREKEEEAKRKAEKEKQAAEDAKKERSIGKETTGATNSSS